MIRIQSKLEMIVRAVVHDSPVGLLTLVSDGTCLVGLHFDGLIAPPASPPGLDQILASAIRQLDAYFAGRLKQFDLPLRPVGTPFQLKVWSALQDIPLGETRSYGQVAKAIGRPSSTRAVGAANGRNPIAIVVPCHRVIGADGSLTGFGGGIERKRFLLSLEQGCAFRLTG